MQESIKKGLQQARRRSAGILFLATLLFFLPIVPSWAASCHDHMIPFDRDFSVPVDKDDTHFMLMNGVPRITFRDIAGFASKNLDLEAVKREVHEIFAIATVTDTVIDSYNIDVIIVNSIWEAYFFKNYRNAIIKQNMGSYNMLGLFYKNWIYNELINSDDRTTLSSASVTIIFDPHRKPPSLLVEAIVESALQARIREKYRDDLRKFLLYYRSRLFSSAMKFDKGAFMMVEC